MVSVDVTSNDPYDPVSVVNLELNGTTIDYMNFTGNGRYRLRLSSITDFQDGKASIVGKACTGTAACGQATASLDRFTPSPRSASATISASWQEEEEEGPVTRFADYGHQIRQMYTTTTFSCCEIGETSHIQIRDSLVTISGHEPMPQWTAAIDTRNTNNSASYDLHPTDENPVGCTYLVTCSSKSGGVASTFGYAPTVHEALSSFNVDGAGAFYSNATLDISWP